MKIRTKLSGVVWILVGTTLVLCGLFSWGGLRFQHYLHRIQLAHEQHHALPDGVAVLWQGDGGGGGIVEIHQDFVVGR